MESTRSTSERMGRVTDAQVCSQKSRTPMLLSTVTSSSRSPKEALIKISRQEVLKDDRAIGRRGGGMQGVCIATFRIKSKLRFLI